MSETRQQRRQAKRSHQQETGTPRRFYWAMGVLALAGVTLGVIGLLSSQGSPGSVVPGGVSAAAARAETQSFPSEYDTLGVSIGPLDAPVVVREFADYQCPACGEFAPTAKQVRQEYVASGQVRFILFDMPLSDVHPNALVAAQAARCAGEQGRYWEMHDALFENQAEWSPAPDPLGHFSNLAREVGVNGVELSQCVESGQTQAAVQQSYDFASAIGVRSTPTIVVGNVPLTGAQPYERVRSLIEEQLAQRAEP